MVLPLAALLLTSFQRFATVILPQTQFTLANYESGVRLCRGHASRLTNSLMLGVRRRHGRRGDHDGAGVDHLPLARAGTRR